MPNKDIKVIETFIDGPIFFYFIPILIDEVNLTTISSSLKVKTAMPMGYKKTVNGLNLLVLRFLTQLNFLLLAVRGLGTAEMHTK